MVGQLDTSALDPGNFKSVRDLNVQNALENQKINSGNIANAQAGSIYAAQVLTGAVKTGDQNVYNNAKAHLGGLGIDVSGLAPDIQTGAQQVQAIREAQYSANPLNQLLGLDLKAGQNMTAATAAAGNTAGAAAIDPAAAAIQNKLNARLGLSSAPNPAPNISPENPGMNLQPDDLKSDSASINKAMGVPQAAMPAAASNQPMLDANGSTPVNFVAPQRQPGDTQAAYNQSYQQAFDAWKSNPAVQQESAKDTTIGTDIAKQTGASAETQASYDKLFQNLEAMKKLNDSVPDSFGVSPDLKADIGKRFGFSGDAGALAQWDQINHSQILNGLQQLVNQAGAGSSIRSNKTIVQLLATGQGIPADLPKAARTSLINNLEAELKNTMTASGNVKSNLEGQPQEPMAAIPISTPKGGVVHFNDLPQ